MAILYHSSCGTIGRSREGAWIEIVLQSASAKELKVAPARERGLKLPGDTFTMDCTCRSREGAWIEIKASERYGAETAKSLPRGSVD